MSYVVQIIEQDAILADQLDNHLCPCRVALEVAVTENSSTSLQGHLQAKKGAWERKSLKDNGEH